MSQLLITIITGLISLLFFIPDYLSYQEHSSEYLYYGLIFIVIVLIILSFILYFNISILTTLTNKIKFIKHSRFQKYIEIFTFYSNKELLKVLLLSNNKRAEAHNFYTKLGFDSTEKKGFVYNIL